MTTLWLWLREVLPQRTPASRVEYRGRACQRRIELEAAISHIAKARSARPRGCIARDSAMWPRVASAIAREVPHRGHRRPVSRRKGQMGGSWRSPMRIAIRT